MSLNGGMTWIPDSAAGRRSESFPQPFPASDQFLTIPTTLTPGIFSD
jgi:hypothetical protein